MEGTCIYLLILGTQWVGVVWVMSVCEGPALWGTGIMDDRVGSGQLLGLR